MNNSLVKKILTLFSLLLTLPLSAQKLYPFIEDGKYGFKDEVGYVVVPAKFEGVKTFTEGLAGIKHYGQWGFMDTTGQIIIACHFDFVCPFSEGLAGVEENGKWGFIDKTGEMVIPAQFDDIWSSKFIDGLAKVERNGSKFYIDKKGLGIKRVKKENRF